MRENERRKRAQVVESEHSLDQVKGKAKGKAGNSLQPPALLDHKRV